MSLPVFEHFPRPRFGPRRDYSYLTEEPEITRMCRLMGKEPQPWQRYVWAVGTEYRLDAQGRKQYHYRDVMVTVPRQSGKTTLLQPLRLYRMTVFDGAYLFATAQTQKHASKRMLAMINAVENSRLGPLFKARRGKGDAGLVLKANGTDLAQFTPNEEAIHGETTPYVDLDEIWYFTRELGEAIMGGVRPAQITLGAQAQRWYVSTMGTLASEFMNDMVEAGRKGTPGFCYIEYSMPDGLDPYDPKTWWLFHPGLGNIIQEEDLQAETTLPEGQWLRAYCNRLTEVTDALMPLEDWDAMTDPARTIPPPSDVTVAFEVSPGNLNAAVVAAWHDDQGTPNAYVLHQAPGTVWVPGYLAMLRTLGFEHLAADDAGPVRRILDQLPDEWEVQRLSFAERRLADQTLITAARDDQRLIHDGSRPLRLALASAQTRINNGVELIDRDRSLNPVPSLIALSVALYAHAHPADTYKPVLVA